MNLNQILLSLVFLFPSPVLNAGTGAPILASTDTEKELNNKFLPQLQKSTELALFVREAGDMYRAIIVRDFLQARGIFSKFITVSSHTAKRGLPVTARYTGVSISVRNELGSVEERVLDLVLSDKLMSLTEWIAARPFASDGIKVVLTRSETEIELQSARRFLPDSISLPTEWETEDWLEFATTQLTEDLVPEHLARQTRSLIFTANFSGLGIEKGQLSKIQKNLGKITDTQITDEYLVNRIEMKLEGITVPDTLDRFLVKSPYHDRLYAPTLWERLTEIIKGLAAKKDAGQALFDYLINAEFYYLEDLHILALAFVEPLLASSPENRIKLYLHMYGAARAGNISTLYPRDEVNTDLADLARKLIQDLPLKQREELGSQANKKLEEKEEKRAST